MNFHRCFMSNYPALYMTKMRHIVISLLFFALATSLAWSKSTDAAYKGAIIIDAVSGQVLFEDNPDIVSPPASITKLMTFLIVHDRIASDAITLQTQVPVNAASSKIGGTQVWLKHGESFPVEEMLYALMIQSANDCAHALAVTVAGSPEAFVELMNARAKQLGMTNTTFRSPHGLPPSNRRTADGDLTSPRDLAVLSQYLIQNTDILHYSSIKERPFREGAPEGRIIMRNHNHLIDNVEGVDGLKTGYTRGAGFCLAATARRDGRRIIAVIMGSETAKGRDLKMAELIQQGFASLAPSNSPLSMAPLPAGIPSNTMGPKTQVEPAPESSPVIKFSIPGK
jgi:D-alanyl-D-alanine carboxypeptidase